jgi:hypothetical protein
MVKFRKKDCRLNSPHPEIIWKYNEYIFIFIIHISFSKERLDGIPAQTVCLWFCKFNAITFTCCWLKFNICNRLLITVFLLYWLVG